MHSKRLFLNESWQCKVRTPDISLADDFAFSASAEWFSAQVPGTVQQDLLAHRRIPDPFFGLNEQDIQWIGERDWLYTCRFMLPDDWEQDEHVDLCCEGLDTFATVWLNGTEIIVSENMFVPVRVHVASLLRTGENELRILFESALRRGKALEERYGVRTVWGESDTSRVYVRKAQYHYGWDWGPVIQTVGIWRPIYLETYAARIVDLFCPMEVAADLQQATLAVIVELEQIVSSAQLLLQVYTPAGELLAEKTVVASQISSTQTFLLEQPELWWPLNYGEQALYTVAVQLMQDGNVLDQRERRIGLRRLRLLQHAFEDQPGSAFCFEVNNTPIFCGGANWIPADSLLPRITPDRYRRWLQLAADANMTMLRVWGGGIYEEDVFYDTCDELGLLVWQDFMFACALYPAHGEFQKSVRAEVEANVRRLRNHPSLVLWCGNNEDYMHSYPMGLYDANFQGDFATTSFPAREIYERLLPAICGHLDPTRPYWPGSPYGGVNANEMLRGDQHIWDIWHGSMASYHDYARYPGRFVSEFGMQALPQRSTLELFAVPEELYPLSRTLEHHNKAPDGSRRLAVYLSDTVHLPIDLDEYIYATQFVQAEAVAAGLRGWRRQFAGPGREYTAGALVWQINDCWPVTSWALVDSELQAKPAYYLTRRVLAPLTVELAKASPSQAAIWAVNGRMVPVEVELEVRRWLLDGTLIDEQRRVLLLPPNQSIELGQQAYCFQDRQIISARLMQQDKTIARAALWPEPFKHLTLPDPEITIEWLDAQTLQIATRRPAKGLWLSSSQPVQWSDNMLDLLPGDPQVVRGVGLEEAQFVFRWLH